MKTLHIITGLSTGGAEQSLHKVLAGSLAERFSSEVLSLRREGTIGPRLRELSVPVHTLNMRAGLPSPQVVASLRRIVRESAPEIIQGWMYHGNLAASVAARLARGRPAVAWNVRHSLYGLAAEKPLTRQVIRANRWRSERANAIIYNSETSRVQHEAFGFAAPHATVIPNGFDVNRLVPDPETGSAVRRALGFAKNALVVGHVARFHPMKDHSAFLHAAVRVAYAVPAARFLMVGRGVNLGNPALAGIVPTDLIDRFTFTGERSDPHDLMQAMDVFCTSSNSEAFPNVLGEAMACGVPCVATDAGDSADIVGETGLIVPRSDSEALAQALLAMLQKSSAEREAFGRSARRRVQTNYELGRIVAQYAELYDQLKTKDKA